MTDKLPIIIKWKPWKDKLGFPQPDIPIKYVECNAIADKLKDIYVQATLAKQFANRSHIQLTKVMIKQLIKELEGKQ